jgi:diguanylate cyclase (GGDEF)-like protein
MGGSVRWWEIGAAIALQGIVGSLLLVGGRRGWLGSVRLGLVVVIAYLASVGLLRDAAGATAGFGPLALLPVMWAALRGRRVELAVAVGGVGVLYIAPAILVGPPHYPVGSWRAGLLFTTILGSLGISVISLVRRLGDAVGKLTLLARTDELTALPNRRAWRELLQRELQLAARTRRPLTVVVLDLDGFKHYNDEHGHLAGDRILRRAAGAWQGALREADVLGRWGGDEFTLLLPDCDRAGADAVLERLRTACPEARFCAGVAQSNSASTAESILRRGDEALYEVKRARPGSVEDPSVVLEALGSGSP